MVSNTFNLKVRLVLIPYISIVEMQNARLKSLKHSLLNSDNGSVVGFDIDINPMVDSCSEAPSKNTHTGISQDKTGHYHYDQVTTDRPNVNQRDGP
jgi:hypothetical protein